LLRIIDVIKIFGKNNLAFCEKYKKIYQNSNDNFLSLIEMIVEFDSSTIFFKLTMMKFIIIILDIIYNIS